MAHLLEKNVAMLLSRQVGGSDWRHVSVANRIVDNFAVSLNSKEGCHVFPLFGAAGASEDVSHAPSFGLFESERRSHLNQEQMEVISRGLGLQWSDGTSDKLGSGDELTSMDVFAFAYAVFHSPGYRSRYAAFLKTDFPRLPLTGNLELFRALARLGGELTSLHLLESPTLDKPRTKFIGNSREVVKVGWLDNTVWINAGGKKAATTAGSSGFEGVPEAVWNFHIGGYQVCEKWLKDRKGRILTAEDLAHYQKIVVALSETIRLMEGIDKVIDLHGGWPGAFSGHSAA